MLKRKNNISNKNIAMNGAAIAVASVFAYSIMVMIYCIIRSSATIYSIMPIGERNNIIWANSISVAYSVTIFSVILALISSLLGAVAAIILKNLLLYFNPKFNFRKAIFISAIISFVLLTLMYFSLYALLKNWMTFNYIETFLFWFLLPAAIFSILCILGGSKLNNILKPSTMPWLVSPPTIHYNKNLPKM